MTCIVGLRINNRVYLAGDSAGMNVRTLSHSKYKNPKVFSRVVHDGNFGAVKWGFGYCGSFRMGQLLEYKVDLPELRPPDDGSFGHVVNELPDAIRKAFRDAGALETINGVDTIPGDILVGVWGRLFRVQSDLSTIEVLDNYDSIGSGEPYAAGCLWHIFNCGGKKSVQWKEAATAALDSACHFSAGISRPYSFVEIE